ncbi:hypothetical protein [Roseovarius atlanticus]|uniref:hypothetical protein n=1 Tax=Roseovarius atlanticus TaxID=1641875 RepID=UPI0011873F5A|nr:hypothetical protein [Roseovarius atlanticus]
MTADIATMIEMITPQVQATRRIKGWIEQVDGGADATCIQRSPRSDPFKSKILGRVPSDTIVTVIELSKRARRLWRISLKKSSLIDC